MRAYFEDYPENSRSAILRAAILVAYSDSTWHELEREQLEKVYRNVCVMLDADLDDEILLRELDKISTDVPEEIRGLGDDEEREAFWQTCLETAKSAQRKFRLSHGCARNGMQTSRTRRRSGTSSRLSGST